jgi:hypothetical protein
MKKSIMLVAFTAILGFAGVQQTQAQTKKLGHVALSEIVQLLPEKASADSAYANYSKELEKEYYAMEADNRSCRYLPSKPSKPNCRRNNTSLHSL